MNFFYRATRNKSFWWLKSAAISPSDWYTTPTGSPFGSWFVMLLCCCFWGKSCASECTSQHNCKWNVCHRHRESAQWIIAFPTFSFCKVNNNEQSLEVTISLKLLLQYTSYQWSAFPTLVTHAHVNLKMILWLVKNLLDSWWFLLAWKDSWVCLYPGCSIILKFSGVE